MTAPGKGPNDTGPGAAPIGDEAEERRSNSWGRDDTVLERFRPGNQRSLGSSDGRLALPGGSDEGLALRFAAQHANDVRYVAGWGRWYVWDGGRWRRDETLEVRDMVRALCRESAAGYDSPRLAAKVASAHKVSAVERLAQSDRRLVATIHQWDANDWLLNTPGGVWDLRSGMSRPARREDNLLKVTAIAPEGECPLWRDFLNRATGGDVELQAYLQRAVGYVLTGDTSEHVIFFVYGPTAAGKTVFLETIAGMLGDYAVVAPIEAFMATRSDRHPTDLAGLFGARLVTASEIEEGRRWAESRIKMLSGGDTISARFMRQDFFSFSPTFKLIVAGNHRPGIRNVNAALRRRLHVIPFSESVPEGDRDRKLAAKLKDEWPGILRWAIEGCLAWHSDGLDAPPAVNSAVEDYFAAEDVVGRWMEERCNLDQELKCTTAKLFANWKAWAEQAGEYPGSTKRFSGVLQERGFLRWREPSTGRMGFRGICVRAG